MNYSRGNELFTSGDIGITKLLLAGGIREEPDTTVVEPHTRRVHDMLLNPLLITAISDGIEFEMS